MPPNSKFTKNTDFVFLSLTIIWGQVTQQKAVMVKRHHKVDEIRAQALGRPEGTVSQALDS